MSRTRTSNAPELLLPLDREGSEPLHRQLEQGIREAIRSGRLVADVTLPSTRLLSEQLRVSRGVVVEASAVSVMTVLLEISAPLLGVRRQSAL